MKPELDIALARNKFLRDWKTFRATLIERFALPVELSENSFDISVPLAQTILAQLTKKLSKPPKIDTRCGGSDFKDQNAKGFNELGRYAWLVLSHWKHVGAVRIPSVALEPRTLELLHFDGDSIFGCDEEKKHIFLFDFDPDYGSGVEYNIVLASWKP